MTSRQRHRESTDGDASLGSRDPCPAWQCAGGQTRTCFPRLQSPRSALPTGPLQPARLSPRAGQVADCVGRVAASLSAPLPLLPGEVASDSPASCNSECGPGTCSRSSRWIRSCVLTRFTCTSGPGEVQRRLDLPATGKGKRWLTWSVGSPFPRDAGAGMPVSFQNGSLSGSPSRFPGLLPSKPSLPFPPESQSSCPPYIPALPFFFLINL